jgi:uncharacterized sulfatase
LFFRPAKPLEELYDTETDPHELRNQVESADHRAALDRLRGALDAWLEDARDLGFVPETELERWLPAGAKPDQPAGKRASYQAPESSDAAVFGRFLRDWVNDLNGDDALRRLRAMAALAALAAGDSAPYAATPILTAALEDPDPCVVYWAATGLANSGAVTPDLEQGLSKTLKHATITARLGAAGALCELGRSEEAIPVLLDALHAPHFAARLMAAEALERIDPKPETVTQALNAALQDDSEYVPRVARHALGLPPKR